MLSLFLFSGISAYAVEDTVSEYISGYDYQLDHYPLTSDPSSITITANCESGFEIDRELSECNSNYLLRFGSLRTNIDSYYESISCTYSIDSPFACGNGLEVNCPWIEATALCVKEDTPEPECYNDYDCESGYDCINDECVYQEPEPECYNDYDCVSGEECNSAGECVPESIVNEIPEVNLIASSTYGDAPFTTRFDLDCSDVEDDQDSQNYNNQFCRVVFDAVNSSDEIGQTSVGIVSGNLVSGVAGTNRTKISWNWNTNHSKWVEVTYDEPGTYKAMGIAKDKDGAKDTDLVYIVVSEPQVNYEDVVISGVPDKKIEENHNSATVIANLYDYTTYDSALTVDFSIDSQDNSGLINCYIDNAHLVECSPPTDNQIGENRIVVRATDSQGQTDTDIFYVRVKEDSHSDEDYPIASFKSYFENETFEVEENHLGYSYLVDDLKDKVNYNGDKDDLTFTIENQNNDSLIYCLIDSSERLYCNAPRDDRVGYNDLQISVKNPDGIKKYANITIQVYSEDTYTHCSDIDFISRDKDIDESDTEVFTFDIRNNGDADFDVYGVYVSESSSYISIEDTDFDSIIRANSTGDLSIKIKSAGVSSNKNVSVGVQIKGKFYNGEDCSFSEIDDDFELEIKNKYTSYDSSCNDVKVVRETLEIDESDTDTLYFTIENDGESDFEMEDLQISETSDYLRVLDFDEEGEIRENNEKRFAVKLRSTSVSSDKTVKLEVDFKGRFDDGEYCSFSEIDYEYFKVKIDNGGYSSSSDSRCEDIELSVSDTTVPENSSKTKVVTIRNTGERNFTVYSVKEKETNPYFDVSIRSKPTMVYSGNSKEISLKIETENVSSTKTGEVELSVSGRFSDGYYCSTSSIKKDFDVKVTNSSYYPDEDDEDDNENQEELSGNVEFSFNESFITLKENERKTIIATIKNATDRRDCFVVTAKDSVFVDADVSGTEFCLNSGESKNATISLVGKEQGSTNIQVKVTYDNKSKSKFVTVEVLKKEIQLSVEVVDANSEIITIENTANTVRNVVIKVVNPPEGVTIQEIVLDEWCTGEIIELPIEFEEGFEGAVESIIRVSSNEGNLSVPVKFIVEKEEPITSGLVGLATTAGLAIGLLILVILAVIGVLAVFSKN